MAQSSIYYRWQGDINTYSSIQRERINCSLI